MLLCVVGDLFLFSTWLIGFLLASCFGMGEEKRGMWGDMALVGGGRVLELEKRRGAMVLEEGVRVGWGEKVGGGDWNCMLINWGREMGE